MLTDSLYTGVVEWGRTTAIPDRTPVPYSHHFPELQIISFEQFNQVQAVLEQRSKLPPRSAGSPYIYSSLMRCTKCGGSMVGRHESKPFYGEGLTSLYSCTAYNENGKVACTGWKVYEHVVTKAVIPFLVCLLEEQLNIRHYIDEEAQAMAREGQEESLNRLKGRIEAARSKLKRVQEMAAEGLMTIEEARPLIADAREEIERSEKRIGTLEQAIGTQEQLATAVSAICSDIQGTLERLEPLQLQQIVRQVFKRFSIAKSGRGPSQRVWIDAYEFQDEIKELLTTTISLGTDAPACRPRSWYRRRDCAPRQ
jgi:site-specific DNA recombinase